ncbi:MAG: MutS-related protein, partial [Gemmatimonadaceae bacterium]
LVSGTGSPDVFRSLLFPGPTADMPDGGAPACFHDLNLDQIVSRVAAPWADYAVHRFYHAAPVDPAVIGYRQAVMHEIDGPPVMSCIRAFSEHIRTMRQHLDARAHSSYPLERDRQFLAAVATFVEAVRGLREALESLDLASQGLRSLRDFLTDYVSRSTFVQLAGEVDALVAALAAVTYSLLVHDLQVTVLPYEGEPDYAAEVVRVFERFRREPATDHHTTFADAGRLNHVEAQILERVARLHPAPFGVLRAFCAAHGEYLDPTIARLAAEVPYYLAYLDAIAPLRKAGLPFVYPRMSDVDKTIDVRGGFDLALAFGLTNPRDIVPNDISIRGEERLLVVSGPNHGGKTTFARMFGQLHYLARLGVPVPAADAQLFLCDRIITHFERPEDQRYGRGKLQDELMRLHQALSEITPRSLVILNEMFSSTTVQDALYLARRILAALSARDVLTVSVTFLDELARFDHRTVSMVGAVDARDPSRRTFRIERRAADGLAYAVAIAEKYHVTGDWLRRRLGP